MKANQKILKCVLMVTACISFMLMGAETRDGGMYVPLNLGALLAFFVSATLLGRLESKKR